MPPPPDPEDYTEPLNKAFDAISEGTRKAVEAFNALAQKVRDWAWMMGTATLLWIKQNLDKAREALKLLIDKAQYATDHQGPVVSLIKTSFAWVHRVKTPVSDLSFYATKPADDNLPKWTGDAFISYNARAIQQRAAIDETVVKAEFVSQWLFTIARTNVDYAVELAKVVTAFARHCVDALIEAGLVITIPWALQTLADAAGMLTEAGFNNLISIGQRFVAALGDVRDLGAQVGDHTKLPDGNWPEAVTG